ncbi:Reticulocyte-binding protein 2-like a, partial [Durusdinium trenchii]
MDPLLGTGLSSAAAEELLLRVHPPEKRAEVPPEDLAKCGRQLGEEQLRRKPALFHRVRLLPDKRLVQQWFDKAKPCQCKRPGCCGGVQWSSRAEKHLGREGMIMQIDSNDDTVLVETSGICECKIWYPRLAVVPVYDPDLEEEPQFNVNDHVECKMQILDRLERTVFLTTGFG